MARDLFPLRQIKFLGRDVSVLGQNEFGFRDGARFELSRRRRGSRARRRHGPHAACFDEAAAAPAHHRLSGGGVAASGRARARGAAPRFIAGRARC